ncbi:hypothetical protein H1R16_08000 [Marnyiella aurantia]|uniref:Uncharacterized protein n=1 Tax=Marnyiella aurantia TaxID=2758037 RepID=A0A7D7QJN9_9FLAO|nr:hypothetical protein [Marnyiella aurantia]MBA5246999.1 hypothetical protein [Marnyiella aurantia]QMS97665.1 hypothetical protein H1R16_08000 [Marnyiella aurantia]
MHQKIRRLSSALPLLLVISCSSGQPTDETVQSVPKKSSIETEVSVQHLDSADVLVTRHKVWVNNSLAREIINMDTIPALGDTLVTVEQNGGTVEQTAKKDYEFYITVQ